MKTSFLSSEPYKLLITRFWDDEGNPTCSVKWPMGPMCEMYRLKQFGMQEYCGWTDKSLSRRKDGIGTLIPCEGCPIWRHHHED